MSGKRLRPLTGKQRNSRTAKRCRRLERQKTQCRTGASHSRARPFARTWKVLVSLPIALVACGWLACTGPRVSGLHSRDSVPTLASARQDPLYHQVRKTYKFGADVQRELSDADVLDLLYNRANARERYIIIIALADSAVAGGAPDRYNAIQGMAARNLGLALRSGMDVSAAVPIIESGVSEGNIIPDGTVMLVSHYIQEENWEKVEWLLTHPNSHTQYDAFMGFGWAGWKQVNRFRNAPQHLIDTINGLLIDDQGNHYWGAVNALTYIYVSKQDWEKVKELLFDPDEDVRRQVTRTLSLAPFDVSLFHIVPDLESALSGEQYRMSVELSETLTAEYIVHRENGWDKVPDLLRDGRSSVRTGCYNALSYAAKEQIDISPVVDELEKIALGEDDSSLRSVGIALAHHYLRTGNNSAFDALLEHSNSHVREGAEFVDEFFRK